MTRVERFSAPQVPAAPSTAPAAAPPTAPPAGPSKVPRPRWQPSPSFERFLGAFIIGSAVLAVFLIVDGRDVLFNPNTATGGDMGAHVWTGDFVGRELVPQGRLTGWSDDWFAGFPVLGFYFPLPFWIVAALNVVLPYNVAFKFVTTLGLLLYPVTGWSLGHFSGMRKPLPVFMGLATVPYMLERQWQIYGGNVGSTMAGEFSFTLSLSMGLLFLGLLANVMRTGQRRAASGLVLAVVGLSHLLPTLWIGAAGLFIILTHVDKRRTNIRNAYAVVAVAGFASGSIWLTGAHRVGLVVGAVVALAAVIFDQKTQRLALGQFGDAFAAITTGTALAMFWIWPFWNHLDYTNDMGYEKELRYLDNLFPWVRERPEAGSAVFFFAFVLGAVGASHSVWTFVQAIRRSVRSNPRSWHGPAVMFCALIGCVVAALLMPMMVVPSSSGSLLFNVTNLLIVGTVLLVGLFAAIVMFAGEVDNDWNRLGVALTMTTAACGLMFRVIPNGFRLWNNRVLPFWLLGTFLLAAIGLHSLGVLTLRLIRLRNGVAIEYPAARVWAMLIGVGTVHAAVALPLGVVPGFFPAPKFTRATVTTQPTDGSGPVTTVNGWMVGIQRVRDSADFDQSLAKEFPKGSYQGFESKSAWPDYKGIIDTMANVGREHGCGRAHWEVECKQDRWGTSLGLMLMPYWTDSCIGSMEGLYYESSATAPYHWLTAALTSFEPSNPQRQLPYKALDLGEGVQKMQQLGIRYYMAFSPAALQQAEQHPDLQQLATVPYTRLCTDAEVAANTCPTELSVYLVRRSELVEPLTVQPAVVSGIGQSQTTGWLDMAMSQFANPAGHPVPLVADGPSNWQRVAGRSARVHGVTDGTTFSMAQPTTVPLPTVRVTNIESSMTGMKPLETPGELRFTVDRVGVPVLVKMSYFPNFVARGADGPYRIAPNFMVVVPRQKNVSIAFERDSTDFVGMGAGVVGVGLAVSLALQDRRHRRKGRARRVVGSEAC